MWLVLLVPVVAVAIISVIGALDRPPPLEGEDPPGVRSVVTWRDTAEIAADVGGDPQEQLRQLAGLLAERRFIFSCSLDRQKRESIAHVDVRELRLEIHVRKQGSAGWILWVAERGRAPTDSDDLRQLMSGLYRVLEERGVESVKWFRREGLGRRDDPGAPSPFYVE